MTYKRPGALGEGGAKRTLSAGGNNEIRGELWYTSPMGGQRRCMYVTINTSTGRITVTSQPSVAKHQRVTVYESKFTTLTATSWFTHDSQAPRAHYSPPSVGKWYYFTVSVQKASGEQAAQSTGSVALQPSRQGLSRSAVVCAKLVADKAAAATAAAPKGADTLVFSTNKQTEIKKWEHFFRSPIRSRARSTSPGVRQQHARSPSTPRAAEASAGLDGVLLAPATHGKSARHTHHADATTSVLDASSAASEAEAALSLRLSALRSEMLAGVEASEAATRADIEEVHDKLSGEAFSLLDGVWGLTASLTATLSQAASVSAKRARGHAAPVGGYGSPASPAGSAGCSRIMDDVLERDILLEAAERRLGCDGTPRASPGEGGAGGSTPKKTSAAAASAAVSPPPLRCAQQSRPGKAWLVASAEPAPFRLFAGDGAGAAGGQTVALHRGAVVVSEEEEAGGGGGGGQLRGQTEIAGVIDGAAIAKKKAGSWTETLVRAELLVGTHAYQVPRGLSIRVTGLLDGDDTKVVVRALCVGAVGDPSRYFELVQGDGWIVVGSEGATVRAGPSLESRIVGTEALPHGTLAWVTEIVGHRARIASPVVGWVSTISQATLHNEPKVILEKASCVRQAFLEQHCAMLKQQVATLTSELTSQVEAAAASAAAASKAERCAAELAASVALAQAEQQTRAAAHAELVADLGAQKDDLAAKAAALETSLREANEEADSLDAELSKQDTLSQFYLRKICQLEASVMSLTSEHSSTLELQKTLAHELALYKTKVFNVKGDARQALAGEAAEDDEETTADSSLTSSMLSDDVTPGGERRRRRRARAAEAALKAALECQKEELRLKAAALDAMSRKAIDTEAALEADVARLQADLRTALASEEELRAQATAAADEAAVRLQEQKEKAAAEEEAAQRLRSQAAAAGDASSALAAEVSRLKAQAATAADEAASRLQEQKAKAAAAEEAAQRLRLQASAAAADESSALAAEVSRLRTQAAAAADEAAARLQGQKEQAAAAQDRARAQQAAAAEEAERRLRAQAAAAADEAAAAAAEASRLRARREAACGEAEERLRGEAAEAAAALEAAREEGRRGEARAARAEAELETLGSLAKQAQQALDAQGRRGAEDAAALRRAAREELAAALAAEEAGARARVEAAQRERGRGAAARRTRRRCGGPRARSWRRRWPRRRRARARGWRRRSASGTRSRAPPGPPPRRRRRARRAAPRRSARRRRRRRRRRRSGCARSCGGAACRARPRGRRPRRRLRGRPPRSARRRRRRGRLRPGCRRRRRGRSGGGGRPPCGWTRSRLRRPGCSGRFAAWRRRPRRRRRRRGRRRRRWWRGVRRGTRHRGACRCWSRSWTGGTRWSATWRGRWRRLRWGRRCRRR